MTDKRFIARIPFDKKWGKTFSYRRDQVILEHMIQMTFEWWEAKFREHFKDETWELITEEVPETFWMIYQFKRREEC